MPSAHAILWFLGMFVILWALSLIGRGLWGDRARGRRRCPACAASIADLSSRSCSACGYEARSERVLLSPRRNWRMVVAGAVLVPVGGGVCYLGVVVWAWTHMNHDVGLALTVWNSSAVALATFGLIAIGWAVRGERSRGRRRCPRCWYDMSGSGLRCPECGNEARHTSHLYRPRRRWKAAALASLLLVAAALMQGVPRVQRGGWRAAVPTTVLIAGLPWLPDALATEASPKAEENWTLLGRTETGGLWHWQTKWLERRAGALLDRAQTAQEVRRGVHFASTRVARPSLTRALVLCVNALGSPSQAERDAAVDCLTDLQNDFPKPTTALRAALTPELPELLRILQDDQQPSGVVWTAAWAASLMGPSAAPAVPRLLAIAAKGGRVRMYGAVGPLRSLAVLSPEIKSVVVRAIDDPDPAVSQVACWVLATTSLCDDVTAGRLLRALHEADDARAADAANTLCRALWNPGVAIPAVIDELGGARAKRVAFADMLWYYEDELLPYLPRLVELLDDPDPAVRTAVITNISACSRGGRFELGRSAVYPIIAAMQNDPDANVKLAATTAIADIPINAPAPR